MSAPSHLIEATCDQTGGSASALHASPRSAAARGAVPVEMLRTARAVVAIRARWALRSQGDRDAAALPARPEKEIRVETMTTLAACRRAARRVDPAIAGTGHAAGATVARAAHRAAELDNRFGSLGGASTIASSTPLPRIPSSLRPRLLPGRGIESLCAAACRAGPHAADVGSGGRSGRVSRGQYAAD